MGEIYIRFSFNTQTGEKEIIIEYESDADMTTLEHEHKHRDIVEQLLGKGIIEENDMERIKLIPIVNEKEERKDEKISNTSKISETIID